MTPHTTPIQRLISGAPLYQLLWFYVADLVAHIFQSPTMGDGAGATIDPQQSLIASCIYLYMRMPQNPPPLNSPINGTPQSPANSRFHPAIETAPGTIQLLHQFPLLLMSHQARLTAFPFFRKFIFQIRQVRLGGLNPKQCPQFGFRRNSANIAAASIIFGVSEHPSSVHQKYAASFLVAQPCMILHSIYFWFT